MTETFRITEFDGLVRQQTQRPATAAFGGIGTGEQGKVCFQFPCHFARCRRPHRFVGKRRFQPGGEKAAANIADREAVASENSGDFGVGSLCLLRAVEQQKDTGACLLTGRMLSGANNAFELLALLGSEGKKGVFCHTTILPAFRNL